MFISHIYFTRVHSIWPPTYSVNFSDGETFVISDPLDDGEFKDVYEEEEMIQRQTNLKASPDRYYRLHKAVKAHQRKQSSDGEDENIRKMGIFEDSYFDGEQRPWKAGIIDEKGEFGKEDIVYFDETIGLESKKMKRGENLQEAPKEEQYDYAKLHSEYRKNIETVKASNITLNYTDTKEDDSLKDTLKTLADVKDEPKNCTKEETSGIGISAVRCLLRDMKNPKLKSKVLDRMLKIVIIWFGVYVIIAIPCWCQYGWCCCCCRCKFCRPREEIDDVKRFFINNPVGVYTDEHENVINYQPTYYEKYTQRKLEKALQKLV